MFDTAGTLMEVALKVGTGKHKDISVSLYVLCAIFIAKFIFLYDRTQRCCGSRPAPTTTGLDDVENQPTSDVVSNPDDKELRPNT